MDGHHRRALVEEGHKRLERRVAQIDAVAIAGELDAPRAQLVKAAPCFLDRGLHSRHRQRRGKAQAVGMAATHGSELVVDGTSMASGCSVITSVDVWRRNREDAELLPRLLHKAQVGILTPRGRGEAIFRNRVYFARKYKRSLFRDQGFFKLIAKQLVLFCFEDRPFEKLRLTFKGIRDGFRL